MRSTIKTSHDILGKFAIICDRHATCRIAVPTKWDAASIGAFILAAFTLVHISATNLASHPQLAASQFLSAVSEIFENTYLVFFPVTRYQTDRFTTATEPLIPEFKHLFSTNSHGEKFAAEKRFFRAAADKKNRALFPQKPVKKIDILSSNSPEQSLNAMNLRKYQDKISISPSTNATRSSFEPGTAI